MAQEKNPGITSQNQDLEICKDSKTQELLRDLKDVANVQEIRISGLESLFETLQTSVSTMSKFHAFTRERQAHNPVSGQGQGLSNQTTAPSAVPDENKNDISVPDAPSGQRSSGKDGSSTHPRQNLKTKLKDAKRKLTRALERKESKDLDLYQLFISYWNRVKNFTTTRKQCPNPDPQLESWNLMIGRWKQRKPTIRKVPDPQFRVYPDTRAQGYQKETIEGAT